VLRVFDLRVYNLLLILSSSIALLKERRASWDAIAKRAHHVYRIYAMSAEATDLLIIGRVDITVRNGRQFSQEFAQNFLLAKNGDKYMIRKFQAWIVSLFHCCA
jgi:hypothetical protein